MSKKLLCLIVIGAALGAGCSSTTSANPTISLRYEKGLDATDLATLMRRAGPGPVGTLDLGHTAWVSEHIAVIREGEPPHYHRFHDITITLLRGEGVMDVEGKRFVMKAGDIVHVNRGVRHYFRNTGKDPAATFVVFSPPFDGRDMVTAEVPAEEQPKPEPKRGWWPFGRGDSSKSD